MRKWIKGVSFVLLAVFLVWVCRSTVMSGSEERPEALMSIEKVSDEKYQVHYEAKWDTVSKLDEERMYKVSTNAGTLDGDSVEAYYTATKEVYQLGKLVSTEEVKEPIESIMRHFDYVAAYCKLKEDSGISFPVKHGTIYKKQKITMTYDVWDEIHETMEEPKVWSE